MNRITPSHVTASKSIHTIGWIATVLVIIGALNWLLVGLFSVNVIASIFGHMSPFTRFVYVIIGISGLYEIYFARQLALESHNGLSSRPANAL